MGVAAGRTKSGLFLPFSYPVLLSGETKKAGLAGPVPVRQLRSGTKLRGGSKKRPRLRTLVSHPPGKDTVPEAM